MLNMLDDVIYVYDDEDSNKSTDNKQESETILKHNNEATVQVMTVNQNYNENKSNSEAGHYVVVAFVNKEHMPKQSVPEPEIELPKEPELLCIDLSQDNDTEEYEYQEKRDDEQKPAETEVRTLENQNVDVVVIESDEDDEDRNGEQEQSLLEAIAFEEEDQIKHERVVYKEPIMYDCDKCSKIFVRKEHLAEHMTSHRVRKKSRKY